jgi:MFS family permease
VVNDKFGGSKAVSKANIALHILIYGSLFLCNEIHEFNFLCFFAGFWIGAADSSMMTQIQVLISNYFKYPGQVSAILNIVKTCSMSIIVFLGSFIATKEAFRWYFVIQIVINVACQLNVLFNFNFEDSLKANDDKKSPLAESGGPPGEHEMQ